MAALARVVQMSPPPARSEVAIWSASAAPTVAPDPEGVAAAAVVLRVTTACVLQGGVTFMEASEVCALISATADAATSTRVRRSRVMLRSISQLERRFGANLVHTRRALGCQPGSARVLLVSR